MTAVESPETVMMSTPKAGNRKSNQAKIKRDEEELEALMKEMNGEASEPTQNEDEEEDGTEESEQLQDTEDENDEETSEGDESLSSEELSFKKRYGDLRSHSQKEKQKLDEEIANLKEQLKEASNKGVVPPTDEEQMAVWVEKHPEIASVVATLAREQAKEMFGSRLDDLDNQQKELNRTKAENKIRENHSDFDELRASDEFHNWVEEQPKWIKDALYENEDDANSVIRVIDLYKSDKGDKQAAAKTAQKQAAALVTKGTKKTVSDVTEKPTYKESQIAKNSLSWFEKHEADIILAQKEGRFIYDL